MEQVVAADVFADRRAACRAGSVGEEELLRGHRGAGVKAAAAFAIATASFATTTAAAFGIDSFVERGRIDRLGLHFDVAALPGLVARGVELDRDDDLLVVLDAGAESSASTSLSGQLGSLRQTT